VGNDFLPHLPSLEIREGGLDMMLELYKALLPTLGGYLNPAGKPHLARVATLVRRLASAENAIFAKRAPKNRRAEETKYNFSLSFSHIPSNLKFSSICPGKRGLLQRWLDQQLQRKWPIRWGVPRVGRWGALRPCWRARSWPHVSPDSSSRAMRWRSGVLE